MTTKSLGDLGFSRVGEYQGRKFTLQPHVLDWRGVYLWVHAVDGAPLPRRIGIACGTGGLGGRFALHNRWLAGEFKPDDPREQEVRRLTLLGLGPVAEVWAVRIDDPGRARGLEADLRDLWRDQLALDLQAKGSWIASQMGAWRRSALRSSTKDVSSASVRRTAAGRRRFDEQLGGLPAKVRRTFERFDAYARSRPGVVMSQLFEGRSYKIRGSLVARIDPKMNSGDGYLGVQFALEPVRLRSRTNGRVAEFVQGRPNRPSGGYPWIFVRGEAPLLDSWLAETFDLACSEIRSPS